MASFPNWLTSESNVSVVTRKFTGDHFDYGTAVPEIILFPTIHESPFKLMQLTNGEYVKCIERPKSISVIPLSTGESMKCPIICTHIKTVLFQGICQLHVRGGELSAQLV